MLMATRRGPVFALDAQFRYLAFNRAHADAMQACFGAEITPGVCLLDYLTSDEELLVAQRHLNRALAGAETVVDALGACPGFVLQCSPIRSGFGDTPNGPASGVLVVAEEVRTSGSAVSLEQLFASNVVGVAVATVDGTLRHVNDFYLRLTGYTRDEFESGCCDGRAITPPEQLPLDDLAFAEVQSNGVSAPYRKEFLRRDGGRASVLLSHILLPEPTPLVLSLIIDLTASESRSDKQDQQLQELNRALLQEREALERKHTALREMVRVVEEEHGRIAKEIETNCRTIVRPILDRMNSLADERLKQLLKQLDRSITEIASPFVHKLSLLHPDLSERELEVCELVRKGSSSKQIADTLGNSILTVHKLRQHVRQKLGLTGADTDLKGYLTSFTERT